MQADSADDSLVHKDKKETAENFEVAVEAPIKEMLMSRQFVLLYIMNVLSLFSGYFVVNQQFNYGEANGFTNTAFLSGIASAAAIFNAGRFLWGFALDRYSYKRVYGILLVVQIFLNFTIFAVCHSGFFYLVWVCAFMFCEGGHFVLAPNILKKIFGEKATQLYGFFFSYAATCSLIMIIL